MKSNQFYLDTTYLKKINRTAVCNKRQLFVYNYYENKIDEIKINKFRIISNFENNGKKVL